MAEDIKKLIDELKEYADWEGSELGELCQLVLDAYHRAEYASSEGFEKAMEEEIIALVNTFRNNTEVIEREIVIPEKHYTQKEREWK
jgi:hypothetical protein